MTPGPNNDEGDTVFQRAQDITGGILSAMVKDVPKLIIACAAAFGIAVGTYDHFKEAHDTRQVWQHSGQWATNRLEIIDMEITSSNVLQAEIDQLKNERNSK